MIFNKISTGAQNDLDQVTRMAYSMITIFGMNQNVGQVSYYGLSQEQFSQRPYSEQTATLIDNEVRNLLDEQYERAQQLLREHRRELELLANALLEKEVLHKNDVERMIGRRPYAVDPLAAHVNGLPHPNETADAAEAPKEA